MDMLTALLLTALQSPTQNDAPVHARVRAAEAVAAWRAAGRAPGVSAAVALPEGATWSFADGVTDAEGGRALASDDRLLAGSVGKTFVAATALALVAEGKLDLDAPIGERLGDAAWFARLPNADGLTLRRLLMHRSGLPRYVFAPQFARDLAADPERVWAPADLLAYVLDASPRFAPGEGFAYSDTNYVLVGMCVEQASGATLYGEVRRRFLEPLELAGTIPSDRRALPGLVQGHTGQPDPLGLPARVLDGEGRFAINPQFEWAGGGFASTPTDLARWARALYGGRALDAERTEILLDAKPAPELGPNVGYGMAAIAWPGPGGPNVGHSGFFPGYLTEVRFWPEHDIAVAIQVNTSDPRRLGKPMGALAGELLELALAR